MGFKLKNKAIVSPSGILESIKTVDGSGSGLDSDFLRGKTPSQIVTENLIESDPTVSSFTKGLSSNDAVLTAVNNSSGTISSDRLPSYVDDVLSYAAIVNFPVAGETSKIYVAEDTNKIYRWSGSSYVEISSAATADTALKLSTPRTISTTGDATYSVSFDGSANVSSAITLANSGVTAGTYNNSATQVRPFTVDAKGRITSIGVPVNIYLPYQRVNMTEGIPPINNSSPAVNTICNMGVFSDDGYPLTGHLFSSVVSSTRGIQIITNPLAPESSYIRSRHTNFATGWSSWRKIAIENTSGIIPSSSGFSVGGNRVVSSRKLGWVAPTGTASRTAFSTATVTLPQLAERVKALIDDLTTHGLIGA